MGLSHLKLSFWEDSRQKRTLIFSIFIVIGISLIVYFVSNEILFTRVDNERLKMTELLDLSIRICCRKLDDLKQKCHGWHF
jgi:hypothetical protein